MNPNDFADPLTIPLVPPVGQSFCLSCEMLTSTQSIGSTFCTDIQGPQTMYPANFGGPLTFPLAP